MSADTTEYSQECPVCREEVSIEIPTEVEKLAEARLRMELHDHVVEHSTFEILIGGLKAFIRRHL